MINLIQNLVCYEYETEFQVLITILICEEKYAPLP